MVKITPYQLADGVYFRLGKRFSKSTVSRQDLGLTLKLCKELLVLLDSRSWEDYEVLLLVDTICYEMKKKQMPLVFRMFYAIISNYLHTSTYTREEEKVQTKYSSWIAEEIKRLQNS